MSNLLRDKRSAVLSGIATHLSPDDFDAARACYKRLLMETGKPSSDLTVLLAYGGGKDSSFMTAFARLMQLLLWQDTGATFRLRVATNRHAAMSSAVMRNIERVYQALGMMGDPDAEMILIDGNDVKSFAHDLAFDEKVRQKNRRDILIHGHRFAGQARPTFCNACNISMVNSFAVAAAFDDGVDAIITGDSRKERASYVAWVNQMAKRLHVQSAPSHQPGMGQFLRSFGAVSEAYYEQVYSQDGAGKLGRIYAGLPKEPLFFSIYSETSYSAGDHWSFLVDFLGFEFDEIMFSFSESDCGNPTIMAHMRGLRSENVLEQGYMTGLDEYVEFGISLMKRKDFPEQLVEIIRKRFEDDIAKETFRKRASAYAFEAHGLSEHHLLAMLHAPLVDRGRNLPVWIRRAAPRFAGQERHIHRILGSAAERSSDADLIVDLVQAIGLPMSDMRSLYAAHLVPDLLDPKSEGDALALVLRGDPHRAIVPRKGAEALDGLEIISGR